MAFWSVAQTESSRERTAERFLKDRGFECWLPVCRENHRLVPLFPSYLFVELGDFGWSAVDNTIGVIGLLRSGDRPHAVPDIEMKRIRKFERNGVVHLPKRGIEIGDRMRVIKGTFAGHLGLYDGQMSRDRVFVLLELLGRKTRVEVPSMKYLQPVDAV